ncbi:hypothetical protein JYU16_02315 [bacterium AH-315-M05]|nr:hypothetical protein [bacterium AH-315-M05]
MEVIPKFIEINKKLEDLKDEVFKQCSIEKTSQDARMVALDSLQHTIGAVGNWISCYNSLANKYTEDTKLDEVEFLKALLSNNNVEQTEMTMMNYLRLSATTSIHFKIDNLFHNILKHLDSLPQRKGYWNLTGEILRVCSISDTGREKEILTAFANLRNSLHGNGIHRTQSLNITIGGVNFNFVKDERVICARWQHIIVLLKANIEVLEQILLSQAVVGVTTEIKDDFSSGI